MTTKELQEYLIMRFPIENERWEWKEFSQLKHAVRGNEGEDIVSYISAISNMKGGSLIIGVKDKSLEITGITDFHNYTSENIKKTLLETCTNLSSEGLTVTEYITEDSNKIVWIIDIPKHQPRLPVYAHKKLWQRVGDSLVEMRKERLNAILEEVTIFDDWSAEIINDASIADLDETAIAKAKDNFKIKFPDKTKEVDGWDNITFLNKAKITIKGKITRTAILLLGKEEAEHYLVSADAKIRWVLKALDNQNKDYEIFSIPFLLAVDNVFGKIRNLKYRYLPDGTLFPNEVLRYEPFVIRESLNNAIAHQDYTQGGRINVIEVEDDHLIFTNLGSFIPGSVENVIDSNAPEEHYRNKFLAMAMFNLNLVDTIGSGIIKMFHAQKNRFFPLPDYDVSNEKVKVTIFGKILDMDYARLLAQTPELSLDDIIMLDKVQKDKRLTDNEEKYLKSKKLIEGRKPNFFVAKKIAQSTGHKAEYSKDKAFEKEKYLEWILKSIEEHGSMNRKDIDKLLWNMLPAWMNDVQKKNRIKNLLSELRVRDVIRNNGTKKDPVWILEINNRN